MTARRTLGLLVFGASTFAGVSCNVGGIYYRILTGALNRLRDADGDRSGPAESIIPTSIRKRSTRLVDASIQNNHGS